MSEATSSTQLAIYYNTVSANSPCELCGARTDPGHGPELFVAGTPRLVCYDCGDRINPELMARLRRLWPEHNEVLRKLDYQTNYPEEWGRANGVLSFPECLLDSEETSTIEQATDRIVHEELAILRAKVARLVEEVDSRAWELERMEAGKIADLAAEVEAVTDEITSRCDEVEELEDELEELLEGDGGAS